MAVGKTASLAIPVLASIYKGLHLITTARYPTNSGSCFPAYQFLDDCVPYWVAIRPSRPTPQVFTHDQLDSEEDMAFFLSIRTKMVGYKEDAFFLLEKRSLPEDNSVDRNPKHKKWGITKRLGTIVVSSSDVLTAVTKDVETTTLAETVLSSEDVVRTEVLDSDEYTDCMVTEVADSGDEAHTEIMDSTGPLDCMIAEVAVTGSLGNGVHSESHGC
ncbi:hypothetical protein LIER_13169 [Lithospermum erythrorhizon]|uniref:Uncharacterized protein n=1 Tax=Lithospermum erythrorhizon TaxID=34254 RepID=A0AAV3PZR3_LITER